MRLNTSTNIFGIRLSDCYFIYIGDDCKEYKVLDMLRYQQIFRNSSFVCMEPYTDEYDDISSRDNWNIKELCQYKKYILIFADLKDAKYFFELRNICEKLASRIEDVVIIVTNDVNLIYGELRSQYIEFLKNHKVINILLQDEKMIVPKKLCHVLNNLSFEHDKPTLQNLTDELEWEFLLKYENLLHKKCQNTNEIATK